ncbi:MAG: hypothetical protein R2715_24550 [Ilumatobacteraceae bacterium]
MGTRRPRPPPRRRHPAAWAAYKAHERVVLNDNPSELHARLVADWRHLTNQPVDGHDVDVVVLATPRRNRGFEPGHPQ